MANKVLLLEVVMMLCLFNSSHCSDHQCHCKILGLLATAFDDDYKNEPSGTQQQQQRPRRSDLGIGIVGNKVGESLSYSKDIGNDVPFYNQIIAPFVEIDYIKMKKPKNPFGDMPQVQGGRGIVGDRLGANLYHGVGIGNDVKFYNKLIAPFREVTYLGENK